MSQSCVQSVLLFVAFVSLGWQLGGAFQPSIMPAYCATDMALLAIPPLSESVTASFGGNVTVNDVELMQVQLIIRHGARTPYKALNCWDGYSTKWDCNVTEVVGPSAGVGTPPGNMPGLFQKLYDAFPADNALGGTCMMGQLIQDGFDQQIENGRNMRDAYICGEPGCLFANASIEPLLEQGQVYLRSDDEQRTVMSGQILTSIMFDVQPSTVLPWHTGDFLLDHITDNWRVCPRLLELKEVTAADEEYKTRLGSDATKSLNESLAEAWGLEEMVWVNTIDCLMTTACTGRELPDGMTDELFEGATEFATWLETFNYLRDDSYYAKLAMAKFTGEVRDRVLEAANGTSPLRFALVSGHDSTLMPFLAAIAPESWDAQWATYASSVAIELLRLDVGGATGQGGANATEEDNLFFRVVTNGKVLRLKGCLQDVCPLENFLNATQFALDLADPSLCEKQASNSTNSEVTPPGTLKATPSPSLYSPLVSPAPAVTAVEAETLSPQGQVVGCTPQPSSQVLTGSTLGDSGDGGSGRGTDGSVVLGIAAAFFVMGALGGAVLSNAYSRRFKYEQMSGF